MSSNTIEKMGYHATKKSAAADIMKTSEFWCSTDNDDWLGKGIYFWEEESHCYMWDNSDTIIRVKLKCPKDRYVDLNSRLEMDRFMEFSKKFCKEMREKGKIIPKFKNPHKTKCFFCDIYKETFKLLLMRCVFSGKRPNLMGFCTLRAQLCSTDNSIIEIIDSKVI